MRQQAIEIHVDSMSFRKIARYILHNLMAKLDLLKRFSVYLILMSEKVISIKSSKVIEPSSAPILNVQS